MSFFRKITARDNPETLAKAAAKHEEHLRQAIGIAFRRAARSKPMVRELLANAIIEGLASRINVKAAVVTFMVPRFKESWHQIIPWQVLTEESPAETAASIAWSLRENLRQHERDTKLTRPNDGAY